MRIGSVLENQENEKRISITPEIIKKYIYLYSLHINLGHSLIINRPIKEL